MPDIDVAQLTIHRRRIALNAFRALLAGAYEVPRGTDIVKFYEVAGTTIGMEEAIRYLEFGVFEGRTMRQLSGVFSNERAEFIGFDSFEGLPEDWEHLSRGRFSTAGALPPIRDPRIRFVKGWFQNTVPGYLAEQRGLPTKVTLVHFDADLYSSTLFLLAAMWFAIPEYYFIFDEFHYDEVVALQDFCSAFPVRVEFFAKTAGPMQVFGKLVRTELSLS